jgi:hypothetical protein
MRQQKETVTPLHPVNLERGTLPWAHDLAGHGMEMPQQLEAVARRLSGMPGNDRETGPADLATIMGLFAENLQRISELWDEARLVMEDVDPSIPKAVNS